MKFTVLHHLTISPVSVHRLIYCLRGILIRGRKSDPLYSVHRIVKVQPSNSQDCNQWRGEWQEVGVTLICWHPLRLLKRQNYLFFLFLLILKDLTAQTVNEEAEVFTPVDRHLSSPMNPLLLTQDPSIMQLEAAHYGYLAYVTRR